MTLSDPPVPDDPGFTDSVGGLTRRMAHLTISLQKFRKRWKKEYLMELREFHCTRPEKGLVYTLERGKIVTIYYEGHPRGMWRLWRIVSKKGHVKILRRPVQHIYPLEVRSGTQTREPAGLKALIPDPNPRLGEVEQEVDPETSREDPSATPEGDCRRSKCGAACNAHEIIRALVCVILLILDQCVYQSTGEKMYWTLPELAICSIYMNCD